MPAALRQIRNALTLATVVLSLSAEQAPFKIYNTVDGLGHNRVKRVVADSRGFLWFCTSDGLTRFDGGRFVNFGANEGTPFTSVNDMLELPDGNYWLATNGEGPVRFRPSGELQPITPDSSKARFAAYQVSREGAQNRVNVLYRDRAAAVWLGTDGGLFRLTESQGHVDIRAVPLAIPAHPDLLVQVWAILGDAEGDVWVGTKFGLVRLLPDGGRIYYPIETGPSGDQVYGLLLDPASRLWIGHQSGLLVWRPPPAQIAPGGPAFREDRLLTAAIRSRRPSELSPLPTQPGEARFYTVGTSPGYGVEVIRQLAGGRIWLGSTLGGLYEFDLAGIRPVALGWPLEHDAILSITEDSTGNVWVASGANGAAKLFRHGFVTYDQSDGIAMLPRGMMVDRAGEVVAYGSRELTAFDGSRFRTVTLRLPGIGARTTTLLQDHTGEWWVGSTIGLYHFPKALRLADLAELAPKAVFTQAQGLAGADVATLFEDSRGDLWIGAFASGKTVITRWERNTGRFFRYSDSDGLEAFNAPSAIAEDHDGSIWIGFREGGVARYRHGRFQRFAAEGGVPPGEIKALLVDRSGRLWCSVDKVGLLRFDETSGAVLRPYVYSVRQGLTSTVVSAIGEDEQGRIYAGALHTLDRIDPRNKTVDHYGAAAGILGGYILDIQRDHAGRLWICLQNRICRFAPETEPNDRPAPVLIAGLRISGLEYPVPAVGARSLTVPELSYRRNSLQIDYLCLSFATGEAPLFQYRLEGEDPGWSEPSRLSTVNYAGLAPGTYRFTVRAAVLADSASGPEATVSFRILPPIWRSWWFLTSGGLLILAGLVAFERYRAAKIKQLRESETRFRTLAETASDAIVMIDEEGTIVFVNPSAPAIFGHTASAMLGRNLTMLAPASLQHLRARRDLAMPRPAIEIPGLHADGHEISLELSFGEFTRDGARFYTAVIRDVTERKRTEEALRRSREDRLSELERVRRRIATDLHDDIGSSLTQISVLSEVARQKMDGSSSDLERPLSLIAGSSRELIEAMSVIVWAINPQRDHLSDLVHRMRRFAADTLTARNIVFSLQLPPIDQDMRLEGNLRREVFLIFKEGIHNMVRHSACTQAAIELRIEDQTLLLDLRDNGRGFDTTRGTEGSGLASMRSRAAEIGASFELVSAPGRGVSITLRLPLAPLPTEIRSDRSMPSAIS